jgi:hypothetical protein
MSLKQFNVSDQVSHPYKTTSKIIVLYISVQRCRHNDWFRVKQPKGRSSTPGRGKIFSPLHVVHTGSGALSASYPMGPWASFPGSKVAGA